MQRLELPFFLGLLACLPFCMPFFPPVALGYPQYITSFLLIMLGTWQHIRSQGKINFSNLSLGLCYLALLIGLTSILHDRPFFMSWLPPLLGVIGLIVLNIIILSDNKRQECFTYLCQGLLIGATANALFGCLQWLIAYFDNSDLPVYGFINQRNLYVHYVTLGSVALAYLLASKKIRTAIGIALAIVLALGASAGGSRSSFLYLLFLLPIALFGLKQSSNINSHFCRRIGWVWLINFAALLLPIAVALLNPAPTESGLSSKPAIENNSAITRVASNINQDANRVRLLELQQGWQTFTSHPLIGVGWNGFALAQQQAMQTPPFSQLKNWPAFLRTHTHNAILQLLVEYGLFGLPILFGVLWILWRIWQLSKSDELSIPTLTLLGIMLAHSMVEYPLWHFQFLAIFVALLTLGLPNNWIWIANNKILTRLIRGYVIISLALCFYGIYLILTLNQVARVSWIIKESREHVSRIEPFRNNLFIDFDANELLLAHRESAIQINDSLTLCNQINRYQPTPKSLVCEAVLQQRNNNPEKAQALLIFAHHAYPTHKEWITRQYELGLNPPVRSKSKFQFDP